MRGLRDGSSRYNSSGRQSIGFGLHSNKDDVGITTPQKERRGLIDSAGFRENSTFSSSLSRSSSVPRRQSLGGESFRSATPTRDRRAMLEAWRQQRQGNRAPAAAEETMVDATKKRTRNDPPLPPSASTASFTPSSRKMARTNTFEQQQPQETIGSGTIAFYDDEAEESMSRGSSLRSSRASLGGRRGKLGSARRSILGRKIGQPLEGTLDASATSGYHSACELTYTFFF